MILENLENLVYGGPLRIFSVFEAYASILLQTVSQSGTDQTPGLVTTRTTLVNVLIPPGTHDICHFSPHKM